MKISFLVMSFISIICLSANSMLTETHLNSDRIVSNSPSKPITKGFILGKFNFTTDSYFVKVAPELTNKTTYLQKEVYDAFLKMNAEAKLQGIQFKIISGTRNFTYQKSIWDRKWKNNSDLSPIENAKKILRYSSMPSTSRHHWGTDLDLNQLTNSYFESGQGLKEYNWLIEHAHDFGFYQVYTSKENGRTGYNEEKWHWSYMPLSCQYLEFYNSNITDSDISGFDGSELASELGMISNYVNGISRSAKQY